MTRRELAALIWERDNELRAPDPSMISTYQNLAGLTVDGHLGYVTYASIHSELFEPEVPSAPPALLNRYQALAQEFEYD